MCIYNVSDVKVVYRNNGNSTLAKCEAVKSSKKELLGTFSSLVVALASGERRQFACGENLGIIASVDA